MRLYDRPYKMTVLLTSTDSMQVLRSSSTKATLSTFWKDMGSYCQNLESLCSRMPHPMPLIIATYSHESTTFHRFTCQGNVPDHFPNFLRTSHIFNYKRVCKNVIGLWGMIYFDYWTCNMTGAKVLESNTWIVELGLYVRKYFLRSTKTGTP